MPAGWFGREEKGTTASCLPCQQCTPTTASSCTHRTGSAASPTGHQEQPHTLLPVFTDNLSLGPPLTLGFLELCQISHGCNHQRPATSSCFRPRSACYRCVYALGERLMMVTSALCEAERASRMAWNVSKHEATAGDGNSKMAGSAGMHCKQCCSWRLHVCGVRNHDVTSSNAACRGHVQTPRRSRPSERITTVALHLIEVTSECAASSGPGVCVLAGAVPALNFVLLL
jgi:hypothetical protein